MENPIISERELEYLFKDKKFAPRQSPLIRFIIFVAIFFVTLGIIFVFINFQSIKNNLVFWYQTEFQTQEADNSIDASGQNIITQNQPHYTPKLENLMDNTLMVPVIDVTAPISWHVPNTPDAVASGLSKGLIQIDGTALPGEVGNVFITGHSSNYPWAKGNYNNIFALLNKVVIGDVVQLKYKNEDYLYKVSEIKVVPPSDISVLNSDENSILTLMTCTPVGTNYRRLIVVAQQIYPDPQKNIVIERKQYNNSLPAAR